MYHPSRSLAAFTLVVASFATPVAALPDDRDQPIRINADQLLRDDKLGLTVYTGEVHMSQGSLHIAADQITIYGSGENADRIVAEGQPATLEQQPDPDKGRVHARADTIEYYQIEERVHLEGNASIEQDGATVSGETIDYFIAEQLVKADSNLTREGNRVQVVIPARTLNHTEDRTTPLLD